MINHKWQSLRYKIVIASVLVEVVMLSILVWNSVRITEQSLLKQAESHMEKLVPVLNAALAPAMFAQDSVAIKEILETSIGKTGVSYVSVYNSLGQKIEQVGNSSSSFLANFEHKNFYDYALKDNSSPVYKFESPLKMKGIMLGKLQIEVDLEFIRDATGHLRNQSIVIAFVEVVLSIILLAIIGYALTRRLYELTEGAKKMSEGDWHARVLIEGKDELKVAADAFNQMASSVQSQTEKLSFEQKRLNTLLNAMRIGVVFEDKTGNVQYFNDAFLSIFSMDSETMRAQLTLNQVLDVMPFKIDFKLNSEIADELVQESELHLSNDKVILESINGIFDQDGRTIGQLKIFEDITAKHQSQKQLAYLAEHDALTGLYNRYAFQKKLWERFDLIEIDSDSKKLALLFFDLDEFKIINDTYGHEQGDKVIIKVSNEINALISEDDLLCRFGGDEFVLLKVIDSRYQAEQMGRKIIERISHLPFDFDGTAFRMTTSLGISVFPDTTLTISSLLPHADIAMYQAKKMGKNTLKFFDASHANVDLAMETLSWNERIEQGLEKNLFELFLQGVFDVKTGSLRHYECLIRLREENGKVIMPGQFIPFAERTGKVLQIDRWVISQAIELLAENTELASLAINISGRSFDQPDLPGFIQSRIEEFSIDPDRLLIELTETEAVNDLRDAQSFIDALHEIGCRVCLDDFGSGFSSFGYMKQLSVDVLKIDGIFIQNLEESFENQVIVEGMVHVAKKLGKLTIAEFVETEETFLKLKELGVDMAQGFFLDKPKSYKEL